MVRRVNSRIRRRRKSGENGKNKAPRQENKKRKKKNDVDTRVYHSDFIAARTRSKSVKRTLHRLDPRLGSAKRAMKKDYIDITKFNTDPADHPLPEDHIFREGFAPGHNYHSVLARVNDYVRNKLPEILETCSKRYCAQLKEDDLNEKEIFGEIDYTVASKALKFYNHKHSTKYVLEETLGSYKGEFDDGYWAHCNFRARDTAGPAVLCPVSQLFFAELFGHWYDLTDYEVDSCVILDGPGRCRLVHGCEICPKWIRHPANGFKNGHPDEYTVC